MIHRSGAGRSVRLGLIAAFLALLVAAPGCPGGNAQIIVTEDVVYALSYVWDFEEGDYTLKEMLLDVYEPAGGGSNRPALILVHGGGFFEGSKEKEQIVEYGEYFARRGFVCFAVNYRLIQDAPPIPDTWTPIPPFSAVHAAIVDLKAAVRFVRANATNYGVDSDMIALLGESAGAVAGISVAVTDSDEFNNDGEDFPIPAQNNPGVSSQVAVHVHFWGNAAHVLNRIGPDTVPIMLVHGDEDKLEHGTPIAIARALHAALELYDVPHEFYELEGWGHSAWRYRDGFDTLPRLTYEFLNDYMVNAKTVVTVAAE